MKRSLPPLGFALVTLLMPGQALSAPPDDLVAAAKTAMAELEAEPARAIAVGIEAWSSLLDVVVNYPESGAAAAVRSGDASLGITYAEVEAALAGALASDILAMEDDVLENLAPENAARLLDALLRLDLDDHALKFVAEVRYSDLGDLRKVALRHFVIAGDLQRAASVADGELAYVDEIARLLLDTKGPALALANADLISYGDDGLELKMATLAEIARRQSPSASQQDLTAAEEALSRLKDIASGRTFLGPLGIAALTSLGLGSLAWRFAPDEEKPGVVAALAAGGYFVEAKSLAFEASNRTDAFITVALAQTRRGDVSGAIMTLGLIEAADHNATARAIAYARIGMLDEAARIAREDDAEEAWGTIFAAKAARDGLDAARAMADRYSVEQDLIMRDLLLGLSLHDPEQAGTLAGNQTDLSVEMARILVARADYAGALLVLSIAAELGSPFDREKALDEANALQFETAMLLGDLALAGRYLPSRWVDEGQWSRFLPALLRAGLFEDAAQSVELYEYDNDELRADGWWQVAIAMARERGVTAARELLMTRLDADPTTNQRQWARVLAASRDWRGLAALLQQVTADDLHTRAFIEITILSNL